MRPTYFATPDEFRAWLAEHHASERELWVGFHRKSSGRPSITWPEAVGQALCFGWIDGVRRSVDDESYANRFTPRTARSTWSAVNIRSVKELIAAGLMHPAGLAAFERRADERSAIYSYEQRHAATLDAADEARFRANPPAWDWFQSQPPSYRTAAAHWVVTAKREETRRRRLETLIEDSAKRRRVGPLTPPARRGR
ncbi:MAG: YdeI/OmpD-associated family protein [Chloroflexota bacterium]|nr:YdeI/OmpD-associated family protein [Chloroflexota bacterium]